MLELIIRIESILSRRDLTDAVRAELASLLGAAVTLGLK